MTAQLQLLARTGHPDFLDLPWDRAARGSGSTRGWSRSCAGSAATSFASSSTTAPSTRSRSSRRSWPGASTACCAAGGRRSAGGRRGRRRGRSRGDDLEAVLITRHLDFSLPYRTCSDAAASPDLRRRAARRRRAAARSPPPRRLLLGRLLALEHALPPRRRSPLRLPRRRRDGRAPRRLLGRAARARPGDRRGERGSASSSTSRRRLGREPASCEPEETAATWLARYEALWHELTRDEVFGPTSPLQDRRSGCTG